MEEKKARFKVADSVLRLNYPSSHEDFPSETFDPGDEGVIVRVLYGAYHVRSLRNRLIYTCLEKNLTSLPRKKK